MPRKTKAKYCPDLVSQMAECDANYLRLAKLLPDLDGDGVRIGIRPEDARDRLTEVAINVRERCRYTTMVTIRVSGAQDSTWLRWPTLEVRLYHDLKTCEVVALDHHRRFEANYEYPNRRMHQPNEKAQLNQFLGELLSHCLQHGHSTQPLPVV